MRDQFWHTRSNAHKIASLVNAIMCWSHVSIRQRMDMRGGCAMLIIQGEGWYQNTHVPQFVVGMPEAIGTSRSSRFATYYVVHVGGQGHCPGGGYLSFPPVLPEEEILAALLVWIKEIAETLKEKQTSVEIDLARVMGYVDDMEDKTSERISSNAA